jgi:hypothetical protein
MKHTIFALALLASPAAAVTYTYDVVNFIGQTERAGPKTFGLEYEHRDHLFSFDDVELTYDDVALTARMSGTMTQIDRDRPTGPGWLLDYSLSGLTDFGNGQFASFSPTGRGSYTGPKGRVWALGARGMNGFFFALTCDGHRLPGDYTTCGIHGWVDAKPDHWGANDFIATAYRQPAAVPLPAGWALLFGALAGLGIMRRARG